MVGDLLAGVGALKTAYDIAKGLKDIDDKVTLNAAVIELQERILSAQQAAFEAVEDLRGYRSELESYRDWDKVADRYSLKDFGGGTFAYELKQDTDSSEPAHLVCPRCFQNRAKSILQYQHTTYGRRYFDCPGCNKTFALGHARANRFETRFADDDGF